MTDDLYCKIFVNTDADRHRLVDLVAVRCAGAADVYTVTTAELEIDVCDNDDCDPARAPSDFLYFPYFLDVFPSAGIARDTYVSATRTLVACLRELGLHPVAACDFEDEIARAE